MYKLQKNPSVISKTTYVNSPFVIESEDNKSNSVTIDDK